MAADGGGRALGSAPILTCGPCPYSYPRPLAVSSLWPCNHGSALTVAMGCVLVSRSRACSASNGGVSVPTLPQCSAPAAKRRRRGKLSRDRSVWVDE